MFPGGGSVLTPSARGELSENSTPEKVLKVLKPLRRLGTPMWAHKRPPEVGGGNRLPDLAVVVVVLVVGVLREVGALFNIYVYSITSYVLLFTYALLILLVGTR